jgi:hypothetical protein
MNRSDTEAKSASHWAVASPEHTRFSGSWLIVARLAWTVAALLLAGNFVFSIPPYYAALRTVCTVSIAVVDQCATWQLVPDNMSTLAHLHISLDAYAAYTVSINVVAALLFWAVGMLIFWRKSREWLGLSVSLVLILLGSSGVADSLQGTFLTADSPLLLAVLVLLFNVIQWPALGLFLLTFPTGRFTPRWSWLIVLLWMGQLGYFWLTTFAPAFAAGLPLVLLITWGSTLGVQMYRYLRRYTAAQRQQVKWFLFVVVVALLLDIAYIVLSSLAAPFNAPDSWFKLLDGTVTALLFMTIPIGIGMAIFRYRLWDIDVIIRRTLVYGMLTVILTAVYVGLIIGLSALLRGIISQDNSVAIVISTLAIAALFQPLRHRLQQVIDRHFYRSKYDAAKIIESFSATLRSEVDLNRLREHLVAVVQETMQPTFVSLWARPPEHDGKHGAPCRANPPGSSEGR